MDGSGKWRRFNSYVFRKSIVSIGWCSDVDFTGAKKEDFRRALNQEYPSSLKSVPIWVGFFDKFVNKMAQNDYVITYDSTLRQYHLGVITGDYVYNPKLSESHTRAVNWFKKQFQEILFQIVLKILWGQL